MAKAKKEKELSLEEKLEQALVPVDEQPYEVPENWCWTTISSISELYTGNSINEKIKKEKYSNQQEGLNFIATKDVEFNNSIVYDNGIKINDYDKFKVAPENTSLLCIEGGSAGRKIGFTREKVCFGNKLCAFVDKGCVPKYVYYYLQTNVFHTQFMNRRHGLIGGVSVKELSNISIPLANLAEQQRIVEQIERLFSKLDEVKEKAQNIIDSYDATVFAILHKAFVGELSAKWRINNGKTKESWNVKKINEICTPRAGYAFDSKKFQSNGCQIIRMGNLYNGVLDLSRSPVYIDESELDDGIIKRAKVHDGDILITLTGTKYKRDYGYAVCIENSGNLYVNQRILCLTPNAKVDRDFLLYYLRSNVFRDIFFSNETGGVNQGNVSSKFVENIEMQLPSLEEQKVIASSLMNILTKEEQVKEIAENVIEQVDLMKKSVLAKSFRGELGTNNLEEESAIELLKSIL